MLKNYLKIALRNIRKHKGYSFINIFGLATGIALCLLMLMYVRHELSYDTFNKKADRIYRLNAEANGEKGAVTPSMIAPTLGQNLPEIEKWVRLYEPTRYSPVIIRHTQDLFQENHFFYADSSFFDMFSFEFISGNPKTALDKPRSIVITKSTAQKLFGSKNALGKTVQAKVFSSTIDFEVTGVIKDVPDNAHFTFDYMASLNTRSDWSQLTDTEIKAANFYTYLLLRDEDSSKGVQKKISEVLNKYVPEDRSISFSLVALTDIYLHSNVRGEIAPMGSMANVLGFSALAFLILLIAVTNYINLATARASRRASEVGIRKALGATKSALIRQFYGESMLITMFSVTVAVVLVELFKGPFFRLLGSEASLSLFDAPSTWVMLLAVTVITAFIAGGYPALVLSSYQPGKVLKGIFRSNGSDASLRKGLVIFQFAISIFLLLGTAIIYQQINFILHKNLGFDKEHIVVLPAGDTPKRDLLKNEFLRQPGVVDASYVSNVPGKVFGGYTSEYKPLKKRVNIAAGAADPDIIKTMHLTLLAGKGLPQNPAYNVDQGYVYLINETLAKSYGWSPKEAIGKEFNVLGGREGKVVGVVQDFNFASLKEKVEPLALFIQPNMYDHLLIKIAPGNTVATIASMKKNWGSIISDRPFEFNFLDQELNALYKAELQTKNVFSLFSILAVLIACLGLLGLSSYMIERRTKEIGVRKVLGATVTNIVGLLSKDFLKLVAIGFILAVPIAWYAMQKWLADFVYKIDIGPGIFLLAGGLALLIALATVSWQSIRAALANPVDSLRSE